MFLFSVLRYKLAPQFAQSYFFFCKLMMRFVSSLFVLFFIVTSHGHPFTIYTETGLAWPSCDGGGHGCYVLWNLAAGIMCFNSNNYNPDVYGSGVFFYTTDGHPRDNYSLQYYPDSRRMLLRINYQYWGYCDEKPVTSVNYTYVCKGQEVVVNFVDSCPIFKLPWN